MYQKGIPIECKSISGEIKRSERRNQTTLITCFVLFFENQAVKLLRIFKNSRHESKHIILVARRK